MKTIVRNSLLVLCLFGGNLIIQAQNFCISGEYRPRLEYHNIVTSPGIDPITIITQRTRLQFDYSNTANRIKTRLTLQDVRTWGSTEQLTLVDKNSFMPFEAWVEIFLTKKLSLKPGRQVLAYDDERILGKNDFMQQSRSHDIMVIKYSGKFNLHAGAAYNNNTSPIQLFKLSYTENNYKTMQYVHFNKKTDMLKISLLAMNSGLELSPDTMVYNQTMGFNSKIKLSNSFKLKTIFYYQIGKDQKYRNLSAYNAKVALEYIPIPKRLSLELGFDVYSGNKADTPADENHSFSFFYGSVFKNVGISGVYFFSPPQGFSSYNLGIIYTSLDVVFQIKKLTLINRFMLLNSLNDIVSTDGAAKSKYLGIENDLLAIYKLNEQVQFRFVVLVFASSDNFKKTLHPAFDLSTFEGTQQWISLSCVVTPEFFSTNKRNVSNE